MSYTGFTCCARLPVVKVTTVDKADVSMSIIKSIARETAKQRLKSLLAENGGLTQASDVIKVIHKLTTMNPTAGVSVALLSEFLEGDFVSHTSPNFPGRIRARCIWETNTNVSSDPNVFQYTLGRLSFGIFQPHNLLCTIRSVRNSVEEFSDEELLQQEGIAANGMRPLAHSVHIDLTIHTLEGTDLAATLTHQAVCYEVPGMTNRLGVTFLGGKLTPAPLVQSTLALSKLWEHAFANAYVRAEQERTLMSKTVAGLAKWLFQLTTPTDDDAQQDAKHSVEFNMKRRPKGYLEVLYLDHDMRITRGNRGSIVVVERDTKHADFVGQKQEACSE